MKCASYESFFEKIIREIQEDDKSDLFRGLDSKIVKLGILGMCNWIIKWYDEGGSSSPKEIYETFYSMMTGSPAVDSDKKNA